MCGVFGFVSARARCLAQAEDLLETGMGRIRHRGPDGSGTWVSPDGNVGLGHVRLSVIDLEHGTQPMCSDDGRFVIVYNGEVYNYPELRKELGEEKFRTNSDTEVVLRAFEQWGEDALSRLRGMFAFAIWDGREKRMFLARDRFGIKPMYWARGGSGIFFASEIKAIVPFLDRREIDRQALADYFTFQFCLGVKTLMQGVRQLPAAHYAWVDTVGNMDLHRYWEVHYEIDFDHTERWFEERLRELLWDSIRVHLRADVEVGAYVSGGVDSSLMASLGKELRGDREFHIFNGRFLDGDAFDESRFAHDLARERGMELHVADISETDFVENIENVLWHLDQPVAGPGAFPQFMVSELVSTRVKVVLGGQGGDEIFGGYARYLVAYFEQCIKGAIEGTLDNGKFLVTYESIIPNLATLRQYKPMIREFWAEGLFEDRDERYWRLVNRANTMTEIIDSAWLDQKCTKDEFKQIFWGKNVGKESYFDTMTHFDFKTLLPALLQVEDRMSMAHGVESRVPLLDHPLVEFAATIPADIKFKNGELKRLLKRAFSDMLPKSILYRKDKMGFPVPINLWLKREGVAREFIGDLLGSSRAQSRPYLSNGIPLAEILKAQGPYGRNLWALLSLELWQQQFIDGN